jgi:hypothetical protein
MKKKFLQLLFPATVLGIIYIGTSSYSNNNSSIMSSNSQIGCNTGTCHGASIPALCNISVTGFPDPLSGYNPGSVYPVTINVSAAGKSAAGINFSVSAGTISGLGAGLTLVNSTSARHTTPKALVSSATTFTFNWTAPSTAVANINLYIAANGVNLNGTRAGDAWNVYSISSPLSIEYLNFDAASKANEISLDWKTSKEVDLDYFIIEKSLDGIEFDSVTMYNALGNANIGRNYTHKDYPQHSDDYYYRLKIVNKDGSFGYSQTKKVIFDNGARFEVLAFPNPNASGEYVNLNVFNNKSETMEVSVTDIKGLVIYNKVEPAIKGTNYLQVKSVLPPGIHFIKVAPKNSSPFIIKQLTN